MNRRTYVDALDEHGNAVTVEFSEISHMSGDLEGRGSTTIRSKDGREYRGRGFATFIGDLATFLVADGDTND